VNGRAARTRLGALAAIFCVGLYAAALGPSLKFFAEDAGVSLDTAGLVLTAIFVGSIITSAAVAARLHGHEPRQLALIGLVGIVLGNIAIGAFDSFPAVVAGALLLGLGDGLVVAAGHTIAARAYTNVALGVSRLNQSFAVGAVVGPLWAGAVLTTLGERWLVFGGIALVAAASTALLITAGRMSDSDEEATGPQIRPPLKTMTILGALLFLYVGAELGLGAWLSSYTERAADAGVMAGAAITAGYWGALFLGRVVSGWGFGRGLHARTALGLSLTGALVGSAVIAGAGDMIAVAAAGAFFTGFCFGPIWPATLALTSAGGHASAPAAMVTVGNAGGIFLPWMQGRSLVTEGPGAGVAISAGLCLLMLVLLVASRGTARRASTHTESCPSVGTGPR
jgi:predicted MFS family arabinose efflux permease